MELCNDLTKYEQIDASVGKAAVQGLFVNGIYGTCQTKLLVWHCQISVTPFVPVLLFS